MSVEYSMCVKLLTVHHLVFPSLKGDCIGSSESTLRLVKMPHCWKSYVAAQSCNTNVRHTCEIRRRYDKEMLPS